MRTRAFPDLSARFKLACEQLLEIFRPNAGQIGQTMLALGDRNLNHAIRIVHKLARVFGMAKRWPVFLTFLLQWLADFLIARWRLRGIARIGGFVESLLKTLVFGFQFFDTLPEPLDFHYEREQLLEQLQQFFSREFIELFARQRHHCGADDSKVSENL
jgi:hypothetical protein